MIGFTADYESGNIKLQQEELSAGAFYTKDNLPEIPKKLSLARKLIDAWLEEKNEMSHVPSINTYLSLAELKNVLSLQYGMVK